MVNGRFTTRGARPIVAVMSVLLALALLAAPLGGAEPAGAGSAPATSVTASARATVRILPGARIHFDESSENAEYRFVAAVVTVEDGSQRDAKLVEFQ
jgi:hypothetical protein